LRLYSYLADTLEAFANTQPVVLILDNLQWADNLTLGFLEFIIRVGRLYSMPLLIIGSYRSEEVRVGLQRILNYPKMIELELGMLKEKAVETIVADMLATYEPLTEFAKFLTHFSEGNPFFVSEYLHTAVAEKILYRDDQGSWQVAEKSQQKATVRDFENLALPKAIKNLVERRLVNLSEEALDVIGAASVIGTDIPLLVLWHLIPFSDVMLDAVDNLLKKQVMFEVKPGILRFVHTKVREIVYERLPDEKRATLHQNAADAIESIYEKELDDHLGNLAYHWEEAGDLVRARKYHLANARSAAARYALKEAEKAYRAYQRISRDPSEESGSVRNELAEKVLIIQGRNRDAMDEFSTALDELKQYGFLKLKGHTLLGLAMCHKNLGQVARAVELSEQSLEIFESQKDTSGVANALRQLAGIRFSQGRIQEAQILCQQSAEIFQRLGDMHSQALVLANLATILFRQGETPAAESLYMQSIEIFRSLGETLFIGRTSMNLANLYKYEGKFARAKKYYRDALTIVSDLGDRFTEGLTLCNFAGNYLYQKKYRKALKMFMISLEINREIQDRRTEGITVGNLGLIFLHQASPKKALAHFQAALAIHQEVDDRQHEAEVLTGMARLKRLFEQDFDSAAKLISKALGIYNIIGDPFGKTMTTIELGHLNLAQSSSALDQISEVDNMMKLIKLPPESEIGSGLDALKRAEIKFKKHEHLIYGYCLEDLTKEMHKWLLDQDLLPPGTASVNN